MIIGNGDIASVLPKRKDLLFFASGVSNSLETRDSEYDREVKLLLEQDSESHIVYFSSLAVFTKDTKYFNHKLQMEKLVKGFDEHTIVRIGNITWGKNPNTLINNIKGKISSGKKFDIRDEYRYIVDKDEFLYWIGLIPEWSCEINITGKRMKVADVIKEYVL